jgi:hypothetical protein
MTILSLFLIVILSTQPGINKGKRVTLILARLDRGRKRRTEKEAARRGIYRVITVNGKVV